MNKSVLKSIGAVLAGVFASAIPAIGTDLVLHQTGIFPAVGQPMSDSLFALATAYRTLYSIAGAYITARLAPNRPMFHALVLGAIGLVVCVVGAAVTWTKGPSFGPHWYPLALVVLALPQCWLGGKLYVMQLRNRAGV